MSKINEFVNGEVYKHLLPPYFDTFAGMHAHSHRKTAYLLSALTILCWSTMGSAFKLTLQHMDYQTLVFLSAVASFAGLGMYLAFTGKWRLLAMAGKKEWISSALLGLLNPFAYYLILFKAYSLIPAQEAVALNYTWPLVLVILSIPMLGQKIRPLSVLAIGLSFAGALVVVSKGDLRLISLSNPAGSLLAFISSFVWAIYWILNMKDKREAGVKLFMNFIFGTAYAFILILFTGINTGLSPAALGGAAYIGLFEMGFTFLFWLRALELSDNTARITRLVYVSPFLSMLLIRLLVGERIVSSTLAGLAMIIGGIVWEEIVQKKSDNTQLSPSTNRTT